jgi:hypothetical protein
MITTVDGTAPSGTVRETAIVLAAVAASFWRCLTTR